MPSQGRQEGRKKMENVVMENATYIDYNGRVHIDLDTLIVAAWNCAGENKIFHNNREFFENDVAWAATLSRRWWWTDDFVYIDEEGFPVSFSHWDDRKSPINPDKIDITGLINGLKKTKQDLQTNDKNKKRYVNNIPRAIHDALQEG